MRVGVISPEFPPDIGGIETYAYEFVQELKRRGHKVTVFTRRHAKGEASLPGVDIIPVLKLRRVLDRRLLHEAAVDVWHIMNAAYAWVALEVAPVVISVHGNDFLRPYIPVARPDLRRLPGLRRSTRWLQSVEEVLGRWLTDRSVRHGLPKAAHIITNSKYTERVLLAKYPACRGITSVALVGVSPEYLGVQLTRTAIGHSRLITVCRLAEARKNVGLVLEALAKLKDQHDFSYAVVGDGPLRPHLEKMALELGLRDRVRFTGFVGPTELRRLLSESDLFVLASSIHAGSHEGFGIAYLEANACGTPVLAARLAGAAEAVNEGISGFFVDEPTTESIAAALGQFLRQEVRFDPMKCREFATRFTWGKVVDHALAHYPVEPQCRPTSDGT